MNWIELWHGDCALAEAENGYRGGTEMYKGFIIIAVLLSISLAGISGCGPAAPDRSPNLEFSANLGMSSKSQPFTQPALATGNGPFTPSASPIAPAISINKPATVQEGPVPLPEHLSLPVWIAQALDAPETSMRLQALDMWAQQGTQASLDPLVVALDDENDDVRAKAMAIIEQHWAISQKAEADK